MSRKTTRWWFYLIFSLLFVAAYWLPVAFFQSPTAVYALILMAVFGL
jgi:hypothetical protein